MTVPLACPTTPQPTLPNASLIQIYWHNKMPIYSVHFQPPTTSLCNTLRFATGGADSKVRIWSLCPQSNEVSFIATLSKHCKGVNSVRWNPTGTLLCSASDGGSLFVWHCVEPEAEEAGSTEINSLLEEDDHSPAWKVKHALETGNSFDIYTVEWTACGSFIAAGLSDDSCRVYSLKNGSIGAQCIKIVRDHQHFVNGIAWDPIAHQHLITVSNDRSFKVTKVATTTKRTTFLPLAKIHKMQDSPSSEGFKLFHDESLGSFFRKPDFTPDGAYCYVPGGCLSNGANCVHVWMRNAFSLNNPLFSIGGFEKPTVGVFFCRGWKWRVREGGDWEWVFCVLTTDEVHVFGSAEQGVPLWVGRNFHLSVLTDASWRGSRLIVTSTDGFASVFSFGWPALEVIEEVGVDNGVDNGVENEAENGVDSQESVIQSVDNVAGSQESVVQSVDNVAHSEEPLTEVQKTDSQTLLLPASNSVSTHKKRITPTLITTLE